MQREQRRQYAKAKEKKKKYAFGEYERSGEYTGIFYTIFATFP